MQREQHLRLIGAKSNEVRSARRRLRERIHDREVDVRDVLLDPPAEVLGLTVAEVMMLTRRSRAGASARMSYIGSRAVAANVNLFVAMGDASLRTREWAAEWAPGVSSPKRVAA